MLTISEFNLHDAPTKSRNLESPSVKQPPYGSLHALGIDVRKKWVCCCLMSLLLLFHLPFSLCSTTLAQRTSNCADAKGRRTRRGRTACGKNVIGVLERLEYREPA
jgi:hypothetical protein